MKAEEIIQYYDMRPLPVEGGYYKEMYRSSICISQEALPDFYQSNKLAYGSILYLITRDSFSRMHFLPTDEIYHFYLGDSVQQLQLLSNGTGRMITLGSNILQGEKVQAIAPANCWHGSILDPNGEHGFALMGTTMAPAWTEGDYIDGVQEHLCEVYPDYMAEIEKRV